MKKIMIKNKKGEKVSKKQEIKKEIEDFLDDMFAFYIRETCPDVVKTIDGKEYYNFEWNRSMFIGTTYEEGNQRRRKVFFVEMNNDEVFDPEKHFISGDVVREKSENKIVGRFIDSEEPFFINQEASWTLKVKI